MNWIQPPARWGRMSMATCASGFLVAATFGQYGAPSMCARPKIPQDSTQIMCGTKTAGRAESNPRSPATVKLRPCAAEPVTLFFGRVIGKPIEILDWKKTVNLHDHWFSQFMSCGSFRLFFFFFFAAPRGKAGRAGTHAGHHGGESKGTHLLQLSVVTSIRRGPDVKDSYIGFSEGSRADV